MVIPSLFFAFLFALVHVGIGWMRFLDSTPRSRWLSAAGGVAVAYVFLHVLPELSAHQGTFAKELGTTAEAAEALVYAVALSGLIVFYALERAIKLSRSAAERHAESGDLGAGTFWLHIGSFAIYNLIIGYLLYHREEPGSWSLVIYGIAMTLHFVTNDFGLRREHRWRYDRFARWVLSAMVLAGWAIGSMLELSNIWIAFLFAFLSGGIVLNVLKEELPEERESRLLPFVGATIIYGALLLIA